MRSRHSRLDLIALIAKRHVSGVVVRSSRSDETKTNVVRPLPPILRAREILVDKKAKTRIVVAS